MAPLGMDLWVHGGSTYSGKGDTGVRQAQQLLLLLR
jgi:hypothetical protein